MDQVTTTFVVMDTHGVVAGALQACGQLVSQCVVEVLSGETQIHADEKPGCERGNPKNSISTEDKEAAAQDSRSNGL